MSDREHHPEYRRGWYEAAAWLLKQRIGHRAGPAYWASQMILALEPIKIGVTEDAPPPQGGEGNGSERPGEKPGAEPATGTLTHTGGAVATD